MARRLYSAFMLRCWCLASGERRYVIEDIQASNSIRLASLAEALVWLAEQVGEEESGAAGQPETGDTPTWRRT